VALFNPYMQLTRVVIAMWMFNRLAIAMMSTACLAQTANGPITIVISSASPIVKGGDGVLIKVQLTNNSAEDLDASANINSAIGVDPNYEYDVRDSKGSEVSRRTYRHSEHVTGHAIFRTLKPGETITDVEPLGRLVDMDKAGKYTVQVSRNVPRNDGAVVVKSNKLTITVSP
jgi:hypothetical protein